VPGCGHVAFPTENGYKVPESKCTRHLESLFVM
jgi:hypothetical protein